MPEKKDASSGREGQGVQEPLGETAKESADERRVRGRELRKSVPRSSHATWKPPADRRDPVDILEEFFQSNG